MIFSLRKGKLQSKEIDPTVRTVPERTPKKPQYHIAQSQLTYFGPLGFSPI